MALRPIRDNAEEAEVFESGRLAKAQPRSALMKNGNCLKYLHYEEMCPLSTLLDRLTLRRKSQTVFPITSERHDAKHETFENMFKRLGRGNSLALVLRKLGSIDL